MLGKKIYMMMSVRVSRMFGSFKRHLRSLPIQIKLLVVTILVDAYRWIRLCGLCRER